MAEMQLWHGSKRITASLIHKMDISAFSYL